MDRFLFVYFLLFRELLLKAVIFLFSHSETTTTSYSCRQTPTDVSRLSASSFESDPLAKSSAFVAGSGDIIGPSDPHCLPYVD